MGRNWPAGTKPSRVPTSIAMKLPAVAQATRAATTAAQLSGAGSRRQTIGAKRGIIRKPSDAQENEKMKLAAVLSSICRQGVCHVAPVKTSAASNDPTALPAASRLQKRIDFIMVVPP